MTLIFQHNEHQISLNLMFVMSIRQSEIRNTQVRDEHLVKAVKMLFGMPTSHINSPGLESLLCFWSCCLLMLLPANTQEWLVCLGSCHPCRRSRTSSALSALAWLRLSSCKHLKSKLVSGRRFIYSFSLSPMIKNKSFKIYADDDGMMSFYPRKGAPKLLFYAVSSFSRLRKSCDIWRTS